MKISSLDIDKMIESLEPSKLILDVSPMLEDFDKMNFQLISGFGEKDKFTSLLDWKTQRVSSTDTLVYVETIIPTEEFRELTPTVLKNLLFKYRPSTIPVGTSAKERNDWMPNQNFHKFVIVESMTFVYIEDCLLRDVFSGIIVKDQPFRYTLLF